MRLDVDVAIVGGGPAGAVVAERLARLGHRALVIERGRHDGPPRGETLHAGAWPMLAHLGIAPAAIEARLVERSLLRWASEAIEPRVHAPPQLAVVRPALDRILLARARDAGAQVLQPALAGARTRSADGWTIAIESAGVAMQVCARVLVDASGRASWTRPARRATTPRTLALRGWWQWRDGCPPDWRDARVEALADGWLWGAPAGDGYAAIAVVDAAGFAGRGSTAESPYLARLAASALLRDLPTVAALVRPPDACDATSYAPLAPCAPGLFRVGDAAASLDPLSSAGLHAAIGAAVHASCAIHTLLRFPERADLVDEFYRDARGSEVARHQRWVGEHFATARWREHAFWARRAAPAAVREVVGFDPASTHVALAGDVALRALPCIVDGVIEARLGVASPAHRFVWLDGTSIAPLLAPLVARACSPAELLKGWPALAPPRRRQLLGRLLELGIVRPAVAP